MRLIGKQALSLLLALLLCLSFFPAALAEEGTIRPVEGGEESGLSGTPAPTEEDETGNPVGDGVLDVPADAIGGPSDDLAEPAADETQEIVASGTCGENLTWTLDDAGLLTISGTGEMDDWAGQSDVPWYSQRETITDIVLPEGMTSIGDYAFYWCRSLSSVTIPESVNIIGWYAFAWCSGLTCVTIPKNVTSVGCSAFSYCSSLMDIQVLDGNENYVSVDGVLYDRNLSTIVRWPAGRGGEAKTLDGVTCIGEAAFEGSAALTGVTIPDSVTRIEFQAFQGCKGITSITLPERLTCIGQAAFWNCGLTSITIPKSVTSIEGALCGGCKNLTEILVEEGNKDYSSINGVLYDAKLSTLIQCPARKEGEFEIQAGIIKIGDFAFGDCALLTGVTIPDSVTVLGDYAFYGCEELRSIQIPDRVTSIGEYAFAFNFKLSEIRFCGHAAKIGENAFYAVRTTAYYPSDVSSWTEEIRQNYGGNITWVPWDAPAVRGDVNGDRRVDILDLVRLRKYLAGETVELKSAGSDLNGDDSVDVRDLVGLRRLLLGLPVGV